MHSSTTRLVRGWRGSELPTLHPYQQDAVGALGRWADDPREQKGVLCLPTGSGKTRTAVHFALDRWVRKKRKVLWLCHRTELMEQAVDAFQKLKAAAGRSFVVGRFGNRGEGQIDEKVASWSPRSRRSREPTAAH